jgi:hypothetical protein
MKAAVSLSLFSEYQVEWVSGTDNGKIYSVWNEPVAGKNGILGA